MTAYRVIDDHKELDNIGVHSHDEIDVHVDDSAFLVVSGSTNVPTDARILISGAGISFTDGGPGGNFVISVSGSVTASAAGLNTYVQFNDGGNFGADPNFVFDKGTDALTVTNISGSLTKLSDGTSYLIAGNNITITTGSNGAVTINSTATGGGGSGDPDATYLVLSTTGSLNNERAFVASTGLLASDGGANGNYTLSVNDSVVATVSGSTFTGVVKFNSGLSGSLTRLVDGTSYLVAGTNVTITSSSNGPITISATAGAAVPGGSDTQVQFNDSNTFGGDSSFTFNKVTNTLTVDNISGSLTRLVDGTSYLVAGTNVVITTGSNGSVTISAPAANQQSLMSWMEMPTGDVDGINMVYTLTYNPSPTNSLMFYVNGVLQKQGLAYDYALSSNTVIMNYAPNSGSNVIATYAYVTTLPVGAYTSWMEIPGGVTDGTNTTFTLANTPWPSSALMLYINGVLQKQGGVYDYTLSTNTITMNYAPNSGSNVIVTYPY
jgi:hypothetical protein